MSETKWIDWHPNVGDVRPRVYRWKSRRDTLWQENCWTSGKITAGDIEHKNYQIPAPEEKATSMKYWRPRTEPISKGWTLADVPDVVSCEVKTNDSRFYTAWVNSGTVYHMDEGGNENVMPYKPSECRVIRVIDPIPPGAITLDKVPENVRCALKHMMSVFVGFREGDKARVGHGDGTTDRDPCEIEVLFLLDPIPEVSYTLETLPVGRVIEQGGAFMFHGANGMWFSWYEVSGCIDVVEPPGDGLPWGVTDYIMELKEVPNA